jgi:CDP-diacylglycerol---serine O-phosphatidyltransferase
MSGFETFDPEMPELFDPQGKRLPRRRRRGIYLLPSFFTVLNLLCGYYAILATLKGAPSDLNNAARAIGLAILFDALDGRIARATNTNTELGKQFDSLADVVSFGIAPAFLAFSWGVRSMLFADTPQAVQVYQFGWLVTFAYVICCAWRLARFNIQGMAPGASRYFVGMPTPAAAGMIAAMVHAFNYQIEDWRVAVLWLILVLGLAILMASTIRYYGFKNIEWHRRHSSLAFVLIGLLVAGIWLYSQEVLLLIASLYVLSGLTRSVVRGVRHRLASRPT